MYFFKSQNIVLLCLKLDNKNNTISCVFNPNKSHNWENLFFNIRYPPFGVRRVEPEEVLAALHWKEPEESPADKRDLTIIFISLQAWQNIRTKLLLYEADYQKVLMLYWCSEKRILTWKNFRQNFKLVTSVPDPRHSGVDPDPYPDPRIHASD